VCYREDHLFSHFQPVDHTPTFHSTNNTIATQKFRATRDGAVHQSPRLFQKSQFVYEEKNFIIDHCFSKEHADLQSKLVHKLPINQRSVVHRSTETHSDGDDTDSHSTDSEQNSSSSEEFSVEDLVQETIRYAKKSFKPKQTLEDRTIQKN